MIRNDHMFHRCQYMYTCMYAVGWGRQITCICWFNHPDILHHPGDMVGREGGAPDTDSAVMNLLNVSQVTTQSNLPSGKEAHEIIARDISSSGEGQAFSRIEPKLTSRREQLHPGAKSLEGKDSLDDRG